MLSDLTLGAAVRVRSLLLASLCALIPAGAAARSHRTRTTHHTGHHHRIKRDRAQRRAFQHQHPCPSTGRTSGACPGYVVDHVKALKHGGADRPSNMQWQTVAAAKAKDKRD
jgi:hypothetical protein